MLPSQIADIMIGSVFLFVGTAACAIAAIRRQKGTRIFAWLGIWSALYGGVQLTQTQPFVGVLPLWAKRGVPISNTAMMYLLLVAGLLSFLELSLGKVRTLMQAAVWAAIAIAMSGIAIYVWTGSSQAMMPANNALAGLLLIVLTIVVASPTLSRTYLALPDRRVLATGTIVFALEALYNSLSRPLGYGTPRILDHLGFAILLLSFGYVAIRLVVANERRLVALDNELSVARAIQESILPAVVPDLERARISAAYVPMSAVAGDFYEFLPVDKDRAGILIADVCGHGIPAALIASMVKVAVQTVADRASDPAALLCGLNRILTPQLRGQLVTAAYLWLDMKDGKALYSSAGHPPLLRWREGILDKIDSNGILFGVLPGFEAYPVRTMSIAPGDRLLLYTDGVTEPENADGQAFGEGGLVEVLGCTPSCAPADLSERLLSAVRRWQPASLPQQDDITLIVIDAV